MRPNLQPPAETPARVAAISTDNPSSLRREKRLKLIGREFCENRAKFGNGRA